MTARSIRGLGLPRVATWQLTLAGALLATGFLVAAQIRSAAPEQQYSSGDRQPLVNTIHDLQNEHDSLTKEINDVRQQIDTLRQSGQGDQTEIKALNDQLRQAQVAGGFTQMEGPGGYIRLADGTPPAGSDANPADFRVTSQDLRILIAGLWRAGAEGIMVNDERIATSTSVLDVGGSIVINGAYVSGPYQISVIGPKDVVDRLTRVDTFHDWLVNRARPYEIDVRYLASDKVALLPYAGSANLRYGQVSPAPSGSARP